MTEKSVNGERLDSVEGFLSTNFAAWRFDTPELDLYFGFNLYPSFSEQGRLRGDTDLRLRWELIEDLYWDLTAFGTYDNKADEAIKPISGNGPPQGCRSRLPDGCVIKSSNDTVALTARPQQLVVR